MKATCEQCGKIFSKKTKEAAASALRMHTGRVHSQTIKPDWKAVVAARAKNRAARLAKHPANAAAEKIEKNRAYQRMWRQKQREKQRNGGALVPYQPAQTDVHISRHDHHVLTCCPVCGFKVVKAFDILVLLGGLPEAQLNGVLATITKMKMAGAK